MKRRKKYKDPRKQQLHESLRKLDSILKSRKAARFAMTQGEAARIRKAVREELK